MAAKELRISSLTAMPKELTTGYIKGIESHFGTFDIPIVLANGGHDGPILSLTAVVHGNEISGIEIIRQVLRKRVNIGELHGSVVAVPVCNPLAFIWREHASPQDHANMAMVFPGDPNASLTRRLANKIWTEVLLKSQYNVDLHHCGWPGIPYAYCKSEIARNEETGRRSVEMAKAAGLTIIHQGKDAFWGPGIWGSLTDATMMNGIPSITIELNVPRDRIFKEVVEVGVRSVLNVMKYLKMIPGQIEKHSSEVPIVPGEFVMKAAKFPRTTRGGIMVMEKEPGRFVQRGETIATVYNVFGEKLEEVKMTVDGYIWAHSHSALVYEGDKAVIGIFAEWQSQ